MANYNRNTEYWCSSCNKAKEKKYFIMSLNPNHCDCLPFCKTCLNAKIKKYTEQTKSEYIALYCLCAELGYPVLREALEVAMDLYHEKEKSSKNNNLFLLYHNTLKELGLVLQGFWQTDVDLSEFGEVNKSKNTQFLDYEKLQKIWGSFSKEDYQLLEEFFHMYTDNIQSMDTPMELRYRDLCKAELRKRKADESGEKSEIKEAEESIRKTMNLLKLDNFQNSKQSDIEKHIERMAWTIENTKPCECEDLNKYKDFSGFEPVWKDIMRAIRNLVAGTRDYPEVPKEER